MQNTILKTKSDKWHAERRLGIGGSDVGAIFGLSKFATPYDIYLEKIGEGEPKDETWDIMRGNALEPAIRQWYSNQTGRTVLLPTKSVVSDKYPFMRVNPDGIIQDEERALEIKAPRFMRDWGAENTDELPEIYLLQAQHTMFVLNKPVCDVVPSLAANEPKIYTVEADQEIQEMIIEKEAEFWQRVQDRNPPDPINNDDVAKMYNKVNGSSIEATAEILLNLDCLKLLRERIKADTAEKESYEVEIKNFMKDNEILAYMGKPIVTWKMAKGASRIDRDMLESDYPEVAAICTKTSEGSRRFLIK